MKNIKLAALLILALFFVYPAYSGTLLNRSSSKVQHQQDRRHYPKKHHRRHYPHHDH
jgi:hypothetical protein